MDVRKPHEFVLTLSADRSNIKDVLKATLHTIFFHRFFTPLQPATQDVLEITLPYVNDEDIATLIDSKATALIRQLDSNSQQTTTSPQYSSAKPTRGILAVQFLERKRRKSGFFFAKADEETVWETWILGITLTGARSEPEAARNRRVMESNLQKAGMDIVHFVNVEKAHIPPITTNDTNPFPYQILVNPKNEGWDRQLGIF